MTCLLFRRLLGFEDPLGPQVGIKRFSRGKRAAIRPDPSVSAHNRLLGHAEWSPVLQFNRPFLGPCLPVSQGKAL